MRNIQALMHWGKSMRARQGQQNAWHLHTLARAASICLLPQVFWSQYTIIMSGTRKPRAMQWMFEVDLVLLQAEQDPLSAGEELAVVSQRLDSEAIWGEALLRVAEGLTSGRRWLWDEAARKVAMLLAAPAAFQGEHFLQVTAHLFKSWICMDAPRIILY